MIGPGCMCNYGDSAKVLLVTNLVTRGWEAESAGHLLTLIPRNASKKSKSWQRRTRSTCDLHGNGNGFSWRSLSHNQELILKKHYPTTSQYRPLSARSELQSHPLAGQAQACGRLIRRMDRGPDGTC